MANVTDYGALLDGVTDDSAPVSAALAADGVAYIPYSPLGIVAGGIELGSGERITTNRKMLWKTPANAQCGVRVVSYGIGSYGEIDSFLFDGAASPPETTAIRLGTSTGVVFGIRGRNVDFKNFGEAIGDEEHASNYVVDMQMTDCLCFLTRGRQVRSRRSRGFMTFRDFKIDHTYNTGAQVTWGGALFEDVIGLELEKFDVVGPTAGVAHQYQPLSSGLSIIGLTGKASVWLTRVLVDNTRGPGIALNNLFNVFLTNTCSYQNLGPPLVMTDISEVVAVNTTIAGGKGLNEAPDDAAGITLNRVNGGVFTNTLVKDCIGFGVSVVDSCDNAFIGLKVKGCTKRAYREAGTSNRNQVIGARYSNNAEGNLHQTGNQSVHTEWIPAGATSLQRTLGAITT